MKIRYKDSRVQYDGLIKRSIKKYDQCHLSIQDKRLVNILRREFINSYMDIWAASKGKKRTGKQRRTQRDVRHKESLKIEFDSKKSIVFSPYIADKNVHDDLFKELLAEEKLGLEPRSINEVFEMGSKWIPRHELNQHEHKENVIYFLIDDNTRTKKKFYVGQAKNLQARLMGKGKKSHSYIPNWTKFRYNVIKPEFVSYRDDIENYTIHSFAMIMDNNLNCFPLTPYPLSNYILMNRDWKKKKKTPK